jgi:leucyl aminopeptidase
LKKIFLYLLLLIELQAVSENIILNISNDDRYSVGVDRHQGRLIFLEYNGEGEINSTVMLVGKGITYDTGGLDIKSKSNPFFVLSLRFFFL